MTFLIETLCLKHLKLGYRIQAAQTLQPTKKEIHSQQNNTDFIEFILFLLLFNQTRAADTGSSNDTQ